MTACSPSPPPSGVSTVSSLHFRFPISETPSVMCLILSCLDIGETKPGSLHVKLYCFTDERFLEVWSDFESGRMKARLQEEFTKAGIDVDGLRIEIENMQEVNDTMKAIESRYT